MTDKIEGLALIEKTKDMIQTVVMKNLKMTEITKLNVEAGSLMREREKLFVKIGEYVYERECLKEDETIAGLKKEIEEKSAAIKEKQKKVRDIREINICAVCGIEVARDKEFCPKCGMEMNPSEQQSGNETKEGEEP